MRLALVLTLSTLALAPAAPALAGDDDLTFDDDGAAAPATTTAAADPAPEAALEDDADALDAPTSYGGQATPIRVRFVAGAGGVVLPGDGSYVVNADAMVALQRGRHDARLGVMAIAGELDGDSLTGAYVRGDDVWHVGDRYSIGFAGMVGVVSVGEDDDESEAYPMVGSMIAPFIWRFGAARDVHLSMWIGVQRNLSNDVVTPNGSVSLHRYF